MTTSGDDVPRLILVVDDDGMTATALERLLTLTGYEVCLAASVAEAETVSRTRPVDAVISDLTLPDGSGLEVLPRIRTAANSPSLPGILLSGAAVDVDDRDIQTAGYVTVLEKPCSAHLLLRTLRQIT